MYFKKNKKEGFTYTSPTDAIQKGTFKADVEEALGPNFQAIKNLGDIADQLSKTDGVLDLSAVDLKVKSLEVAGNSDLKGTLTVAGNSDLKGTLTVAGNSDLKGNLENLAVPKLIGSACFAKDGTGAQAFDSSSNCGEGFTKISSSASENNKGITYMYPNDLKAHGSACGTGRKCQNVYKFI